MVSAQAPAPEPLLIASSTANTISLVWHDVTEDEDGFRLDRFDPVTGSYVLLTNLGPNVTSYLDTGLNLVELYYYRVVSFDANGDSFAAYNFGQPTPIPGPEPVLVLESTANTIRLSWNDIYTDEDGYRIVRYDPLLGMPVTVGTVGPNVTTFLDTGLNPGQWYSYYVVAFNWGGDSFQAFAYAQATPSPAPEPLLVLATTANTILLGWTDRYDNEDGFRIFRYEPSSGTTVVVATLGANVTTFLDTGLTLGNSYSYEVVAFNSGGESYRAYTYAQAIPIPSPEPLLVTGTTANTISMSWTDRYDNEDGFRVERYDYLVGWMVPVAYLGPNVTSFTDTGLQPGNSYSYEVIAFNSGGDSYRAYTFAQATPIPSPEPLLVTGTTANTISLSWTDRYDNEDGFRIARYDPLIASMVVVAYLGPNVTTFTDTGLWPGNFYSYEVVAFNSGGDSYRAYTYAQATPIPAPQPFVVTGTTANTISLAWTDNYDNEDGFRLERYDPVSGTMVAIAYLAPNVTTFTDTGLIPHNWYSYEVVAYNSGGDSYRAYVYAQAVPIPAPGQLEVLFTTANTLGLGWSDFYSNEDGFLVRRYDPGAAVMVVIAFLPPNTTEFLDTGLIPGNWYSYEVVAYNAGGESYAAYAYAQATPVPSPGPLVVTGVTANTISLAWNDIYSDEDGFRVRRFDPVAESMVLIATVDAGVTTFRDTWLIPNQNYFYEVVAFNIGGESYPANASAQATPIPAPDPLVSLNATANTISLAWNDIYSNEDGFRLERSEDGIVFGMAVQLPANQTNYVDVGLVPERFYFYRVAAFNTGGDSYYSATLSVGATPVPAPDPLAVTGVSATTIALSWNDIYGDEDGFRVERSTDSVNFGEFATVAANTTTLTDINLLPNTFYSYRVRAFNTGGNSYYSMTVNATTLPLPPFTPSDLVASVASQTQINLTWTDNANNETSFEIERAVGGESFVEIASVTANTTTYSDTTANPNSAHQYRVRASNAGGSSSYSTSASANTPDYPPSAPSSLTATAVSATQINLAWTDNSNNEVNFQIEGSLDGVAWNVFATRPPGTTTYSVPQLAPSTQYYFRVRATNSGGASSYSNVAIATTLASTAPAGPTNLALQAISRTQINLTWQDNATNETIYYVERSLNGTTWTQIAQLGANAQSYSATGLSSNTRYYFRVRCWNNVGYSPYSNAPNVKTVK